MDLLEVCRSIADLDATPDHDDQDCVMMFGAITVRDLIRISELVGYELEVSSNGNSFCDHWLKIGRAKS